MRALVFGASGHVGSHLVPHLRAQGHEVRAAARQPARLNNQAGPGVTTVSADALQPDTLTAVLRGIDVAFYLVHSMAAGHHFGHLDVQAARYFATAAAAAGIQRIVYLGALIPPNARSEHLRSRREVGGCLRASSTPVTEVRAGIIISSGSAAFEIIRDSVHRLPILITPPWISSRSPPIAMENLLVYLTAVAENPVCADQIYDVAGPELLSYEALLRAYAEIIGKRRMIIRTPLLTPWLALQGLRWITTVPTPIVKALMAGLGSDIIAHDEPIRRLVPQRLLSYEEAVRAALAAERFAERFATQTWR